MTPTPLGSSHSEPNQLASADDPTSLTPALPRDQWCCGFCHLEAPAPPPPPGTDMDALLGRTTRLICGPCLGEHFPSDRNEEPDPELPVIGPGSPGWHLLPPRPLYWVTS